jgi:hypothetical protein
MRSQTAVLRRPTGAAIGRDHRAFPHGAGKPDWPTTPVRDPSTSLPAGAEAWHVMLGTKHNQMGAVLAHGGTDPSARHPRNAATAQRQPKPLQRAISTLT